MMCENNNGMFLYSESNVETLKQYLCSRYFWPITISTKNKQYLKDEIFKKAL